MKVCILIFLVPLVLGTGTKPFGFNDGAPPLIRPLSGNRPYYQVIGNGDPTNHVLNSQISAVLNKPVEKKIHSLPDSLKGVPMGNRRSYENLDIPMGNRPYYGIEKNTHVVEKKVMTKKNIPIGAMGNRRSYENLQIPMGNRPYYDEKKAAIKRNIPMGNRPYYGKENNVHVAEKKAATNENIPMGNRRSYENHDIPMGNRPYYGKEKNTDVADIPMGNRPYYGKEKNTVVAETKIAIKKNLPIRPYENLDIPMGNRPYYVSHDEARPYKGKLYGNKAYYGKPTQEYLNRHHTKKNTLMGNRQYGTKHNPRSLNKHMGNRKYYEDETRLMGNRPFYAEPKHNKENKMPKVVNSPPKGVFPVFGNRPYRNQ